MATHSSILPWRIPWTEDLAGYSLWGRRELDTSEATEHVHGQPEDALVRTVCEPEGKDISSAQLTTCHAPCFVTYKGLCSWQ